LFGLAKQYSRFYAAVSILKAETPEKASLRMQLSLFAGNIIKNGMGLLGIKVPERM